MRPTEMENRQGANPVLGQEGWHQHWTDGQMCKGWEDSKGVRETSRQEAEPPPPVPGL